MPPQLRNRARADFALFLGDPFHRSLQFKRVSSRREVWSARIGDDYRVLGVRVSRDEIVWFWIGSHAEYDVELKRLR